MSSPNLVSGCVQSEEGEPIPAHNSDSLPLDLPAEFALGKPGPLNKIQLRNHQCNRNTSVSWKVWEVKADERPILSITEYEGATTWSSLNASFDGTLQSFLATLPLLIPSIQPHHYGNYWMSQPSSLTCAMQPCLRGCAVKCLLITVPGHPHPHAVT